MSQLTDKEVFDFFKKLYGGYNLCLRDNGHYVFFDHKHSDRYHKNNQKSHCVGQSKNLYITWSYPSRQYPPPVKKLQTCWYCNAEFVNNGDGSNDWFVHPEDDNCPISGFDIEVKKLPKIPATNKESLIVQNVDGAPQCTECQGSGKIEDPADYELETDCPDCGGSTIAKHTTPTLESLGLNPVEVWENAPGWSIEIILQKWENGKIVPYFTGKYQTKSLRDPITLPPGTDWKKCIWKRPKEKTYCKYCLDAKTVPDDGGNGWVPCPECSL